MMNGNKKCPQYGIKLASPFRFDIKGFECNSLMRDFTVFAIMKQSLKGLAGWTWGLASWR